MAEEQQWTLNYRILAGVEELEEADRELWEEARRALEQSYSPYSRFPVGAAALLEDGSVISGANQENAAFPSSMCAERVAIWRAAAQKPGVSARTLALSTGREEQKSPVSPCGACRQVLSEYEAKAGAKLRILFPGGEGRVIEVEEVRNLLPFPFETASLRGDAGDP